MNNLTIELTGNEARLIFYAIKNRKSKVAENVREKLIRASEKNFMKRQHKELAAKDRAAGPPSDKKALRVPASPQFV
jgi:hypothetical protein|uniref:Uncharacterized protein n=1 Tax=Myoviridae sp. cteBs22 TaxID=2826675 RepID=A0A8S5R0W0_9CAUD|nr:MAG TPA: hypothetical protein [Myoviridae sp. cteBs22]